ncbi:MAG TPA: DUF4380 domain-containing protein [Polyangia bacterium]|nr:DUF4380 domain-containing protein [Polyangia bacterium]
MVAPSFVEPLAPQTPEAPYVIAWNDLALEVDPRTGGRITALRLAGRNLLTGPNVDPGNFGSTFWTSPQSVWGWPPVPEIDHAPYRASIVGRSIVMRSAHSASLGVEVEKILSADRARGAILFEYRIHNLGQAPMQTAPWQITRVAPGGLTFYPSGEGHFAPSNLSVREEDGVTWFDYDKSKITGDQKLFADGREGWLAHVDRDALLIKTFPVAPRAVHAPGEAQIEIYANPAHTYIEVEVQGAYETIPPGGALVWPVVWLVRHLPADLLPARAGSAPLLAHVRALVAADTAAALAV